jgi:4-hydroxy-3-polyprenylbenzoate decarboxylase
MLMAAKNRGEKIARISVIIGQEPVLWMVGSTRVAGRRGPKPVDELAIAGGLRNKALEVIKCETNDLLVPAHSEMVIEGEVPLDKLEPEGPYHEMYGYMGQPKNEQFYMNVTTVTHRKDPWLANNFTGFTPAYVRAPGTARSLMFMKMFNPFVVDLYTRNDATGFFFISIDKTEPGQAMKVGKAIAQRVPIAKVVIIVDKDLDVMKASDIWLAMGTRWQPFSASHLIESSPTIALDPSSKDRSTSSKIVIDATRQLPEEGGPDIFPELSRALLEQGAPDAFARVDAKWGDVIIRQRRF